MKNGLYKYLCAKRLLDLLAAAGEGQSPVNAF